MRRRSLIFDDDPLIRQMLWTVFDRRGYEVLTFPDPGLCPLNAKDRCPCEPETTCTDITVSDVNMPNVKGLDFLETLLGKGCRCRHIALMSGSWSASEMARARSLGCQVFEKPFHISRVTEWLEQVERALPPNRKLQAWLPLGNAAEPGTFECVGEFPLVDAKRILALFEEAGILFESEIDDTEIKHMTPARIVTHGGTAGLGCKMRFFVHPDHVADANAILQRLFPV